MIEEGERAPSFELLGVKDGEIEQVSAEEFFGKEIVVLAFYPGDFNPACSKTETGLDELDLFTMQKDVTVLAISGDSVYSHRAFAQKYSLNMALLSDTDGSIAAAYGVAVEDSVGYLTRRAVIVVDHTETVVFTWSTDSPKAVPNIEAIRSAVEGIGDDSTAESRYRVGHARYMEGRRAFTSAMKAYEQREWMMAQTDFKQAAAEFDEAGEEFNTAVRFAEQEETRTYFERAEKKAEALWRAADWLNGSASAFASGEGAKAESLRSDAEAPLEMARDLHEPPDPDDFPPEEDPAERETNEKKHFVPQEEEESTASLDTDIDAELEQTEASDTAGEDSYGTQHGSASTGADGSADSQTAVENEATAMNENAESEPSQTKRETAEERTQIDEKELEEITAELEEQTEAVQEQSEQESNGEGVVSDESEPTDDIELDLTDPSEQNDTEDETDDSTGNHGVPDSL